MKSRRQQQQHEYALALRSLVMIQGTPGLREICTWEEIGAIRVAAEAAERGIRLRYAKGQERYKEKQLTSLKTCREQREEERERLARGEEL